MCQYYLRGRTTRSLPLYGKGMSYSGSPASQISVAGRCGGKNLYTVIGMTDMRLPEYPGRSQGKRVSSDNSVDLL